MAAYRKLGLGRTATGIQKALSTGGLGLKTGDITQGTIIAVEISAGSGSAEVGPRRTGALIASVDLNTTTDTPAWEISGTTLSVSKLNVAATGTILFWVF